MIKRLEFSCRSLLRVAVLVMLVNFGIAVGSPKNALGPSQKTQSDPEQAGDQLFGREVKAFLGQYCVRCHNANEMTSGVRVDQFDGTLPDRRLKLWDAIVQQIRDGKMPPTDEQQPDQQVRNEIVKRMVSASQAAKLREPENNGSIRRLTRAQYRNTLSDLLGIQEDLTGVLPADGVSRDGFLNNQDTQLLSPRLLEAYFEVAEQALDLTIVDSDAVPRIQSFRMDLGADINPDPFPDRLILGANSRLLANQDFVVDEFLPQKPFPYRSVPIRKKFDFIEGYQGNATVRGMRHYDSIYHAIFACIRGTAGYPKGRAVESAPDGLLLRAAIPSSELFGVSSTYGPRANFKVSLRQLPDTGNFQVRVRAARYDDALLLLKSDKSVDENPSFIVDMQDAKPAATKHVELVRDGLYQLDVDYRVLDAKSKKKPARDKWSQRVTQSGQIVVRLGDRQFSTQLNTPAPSKQDDGTGPAALISQPTMVVRLRKGSTAVQVRSGPKIAVERVKFRPVHAESPLGKRFVSFEQRKPTLGVHLGLRRDCGSTMNRVGRPVQVEGRELQTFVFEGAIRNYPNPAVEAGNLNYLAGIREIGVRCEYTDGRDTPRLRIASVEFEGPYYRTWPPEAHRRIFFESPNEDQPSVYAREILATFASRAFRRPVDSTELDRLCQVWQKSFETTRSFRSSVKDALLVVLTSPQFLLLVEKSNSPEAEGLTDFELASKLSYFLYNGPPQQELLKTARHGRLRPELNSIVDAMVTDHRFEQFCSEFVSQWLALEKLDVVEVDSKQYPRLTRGTRAQLRREPIEFMQHLFRKNLSVQHLLVSDFIVANETVANYYGLGHRVESGFRFVPVRHRDPQLGGILSQAGILAGLSDGRHSNPIKRGAWLARKIIAEPPDDPPPNVPRIMDDGNGLSLREKLARHRHQKGCINCHSGIDPWGLPFEKFDASGRFTGNESLDASSRLPDGTEISDLTELKRYLVGEQIDRVAFSLVKHLVVYATGRSLSYHAEARLRNDILTLKSHGYRMKEVIKFVVTHDLFLMK